MFVIKEIARLFGKPCDNPEIKEYMNEHCGKWCKRFCEYVDEERCWHEYMSAREREENAIRSN